MKKFHQITILSILISLFLPNMALAYEKKSSYQDFSAWYKDRYELEALPYVSAAIIASDDYTPLHYHAEQRVIPTASLVKLITAGALRIYPVNWSEQIMFSEEDMLTDYLDWIESTDRIALIQLEEGETISKEDAFASMLIGSANNAANRLPKTVSFSKDEFASVMNYRAKEWGMVNTVLVEPTGLSLDNLTTAQDMVLGTCKALEDEMIRKYAGYSFHKVETSQENEKTIAHTVRSLRDDLNYEIYYGAKTGYLNETGYHLTAGLNTPLGRQVCATVMSGGDRFEVENVIIEMREWVDEMYK